jgi:hypothetical protein
MEKETQNPQLPQNAVMRGFQLGNYVYDKNDRSNDNYFVIEKIETPDFTDWNSGDEFSCTGKQNGTYYDIVPYGIDIKEDDLLHFGFEKIDHHRYKIKSSDLFDYYYTYSIYDNCFRFCLDDNIICIKTIFYIHQLQNLWFLLAQYWLTLT